MKLYSNSVIDRLIDKYVKCGGECYQLNEGNLTSGDWILFDVTKKKYNFVIKEVYQNEWSSLQSIRKYRILPRKYQAILNENY